MNYNTFFLDQRKMGQRIREVRVRSGMTVEQFAQAFMVSEQAVYKWQRGDAVPDVDKLLQMSEQFTVSIDYLVKGNRGDGEELSPLRFLWIANDMENKI